MVRLLTGVAFSVVPSDGGDLQAAAAVVKLSDGSRDNQFKNMFFVNELRIWSKKQRRPTVRISDSSKGQKI